MRRSGGQFGWLLGALMCGCASFNTSPPTAEQQQVEALQRWHNCVDRVATQSSEALLVSNAIQIATDTLVDRCEGHRRDVLLTYPESMERQLDAKLQEQAHRRIMRSAAFRIGG